MTLRYLRTHDLDAPATRTYRLERRQWSLAGARAAEALARSAMARGIDIFTGYGMSETGPCDDRAFEEVDATGVADEVNFRTKTGVRFLVDIRIVDPDMKMSPTTAGLRRDRRGGAVADARLLRQSGQPPKICGTAAISLKRYRQHDATWLSADHGSAEGRHQDRRANGYPRSNSRTSS